MKKLAKEKLLVIIGPTAVGKTKLSVELARMFNGEIISGDSMQIYRGMDIGTAKVTPEEMQDVPHHLIDIKDPDEGFNAAEFQNLAAKLISDISGRGKLPIIAGGTGLYIQSVIYGYQFPDIPSDEEYRKMLEVKAGEEGPEAIFALLQKVDPASAERIPYQNTRRVIRALEIFHCTGKTMSEQMETQPQELKYDTVIIGLDMDRELLYKRINDRVDFMVEQGLEEEVRKFYDEGLKDCQSIQAIGYKELYDYFDGRASLEKAVENLKQNSRRYAKRQLTWFRNKMEVAWFNMGDGVSFDKKVDEISAFIAGKLAIKANR
ncbi:tRNA (adenosine(37)-N6)-dimethylallyltransferase MiaA [Peribacillus deserti]|uniref:tRNA dimethylallyltransferase n=1 Tax=Peribacillus deserti TaxID=673318 RepID=A0A2N5LZQ8_9BACI|nr:tRNA (adenosine(37)-N6)-dimethylallyltransferase MiaA [Peribacillus deserti]PLT27607.1 tRNA (adenosine(37)-N6)-dimethylallyltransferase MiaA [Peribacillus deserti]